MRTGNMFSSLRNRHVAAALGLRPASGQHTRAEAVALTRYATDRRAAVEIGVAEGVSAAILRDAMNPAGTLWLVDPFESSHRVSFARVVARRTVERARGAKVEWVRSLSHDAAVGWAQPIDFLFIDGDHAERTCEQDWQDWSGWVRPGGVVLFHDSAVGPTSHAGHDWGPVRVVDRHFRTPDGATPGWELLDEIDSLSVVRRMSQADTATTSASV